MKYLAIEKEIKGVDWSNSGEVLTNEAKHVLELYHQGVIREIYFNDDNCAVLILECDNKKAAETALDDFPLVKAGMINFEIMELKPYTGLKRLF